MKEFLSLVRDRKFRLDDAEFVAKAFKYRRYLKFDGSREPITSPQDITPENTLVAIRLSSRGYAQVGRRKLFA